MPRIQSSSNYNRFSFQSKNFCILNPNYFLQLGDHLGEMNAKRSLENILRSMDHWPQRRVSEIIIDVSGDPQPRRASHLYSSLQSLLFGERNVRNTNITTTSSASPHTINNISDERVRFFLAIFLIFLFL